MDLKGVSRVIKVAVDCQVNEGTARMAATE